MSLFSRHVPNETLVDFAEGKLVPPKADEVSEHISACPDCATQAKTFTTFFERTRNRLLEKPPLETTQMALNLFAANIRVQSNESTIKRIIGMLVFDDWNPMFAVNERSVFSESHQLLYRADDYDVDLRVEPEGDKWSLKGQLLGDAKEGKVKIISDTMSEEKKLNENCEFVFSNVPSGTYSINVTFDNIDFEIPDLKIE